MSETKKPTQTFTRHDSATDKASSEQPSRPNIPIPAYDQPTTQWQQGLRFGGEDIELSRMAGAQHTHVNLMRLPPGKQSCPFHYHMTEEEHFYVLSGRCILRSGEHRYEVKAHDYICFPAATGVAHSFENPFSDACDILCIGPSDENEIAVYPDSGKAKLRRTQTIIPWPQQNLDYWHGEDADKPIT